MRVLFINSLYFPHVVGGAEVICRNLVRQVRRQGHEVKVLATGDIASGGTCDIVDDVPVERIPLFNIYWHYRCGDKNPMQKAVWHLLDVCNPVMLLRVYRRIKEYAPDVVNIHNIQGFSSSVWIASRLAGVPVVQVLHDQYSICPNITMFRHGRLCHNRCFTCSLYRLPHKALSRLVDRVVGVSRYIVEMHDRYRMFGNAGKTVIYNARDLHVSGKIHRDGPVRVFGFIGGIVASKGVEVLVREFAMLPANHYRLLIAGNGEPGYVSHIRALIDRYGVSAELTGYVDPADFYPEIDVLVVPSLWNDTYPTVIIEALTNGVPVLGSRRGGIPEMIGNRDCGLVFDPDSRGELADMAAGLIHGRIQLRVSDDHLAVIKRSHADEEGWGVSYVDLFKSVICQSPAFRREAGSVHVGEKSFMP